MKDLILTAKSYLPDEKLRLVEEAYRFALHAHDGQTRLSGGPFIEHPVQTAIFLAELHLDASTLTAALLHDVIEDCHVSFQELENTFGHEVAKLVDGVTKLSKLEKISVEEESEQLLYSQNGRQQAASLRKMLVAMAEDVRVVLIKLADRLHNMRTLKAHPPWKRRAIAKETLDIYAPLAHRLGIWEIKWRLEDMAFRHLNPSKYRDISRLLSAKRAEREKYITKVKDTLKKELEEAGIEAEVSGRPKSIYSIYEKTQKYAQQGKEFNEIYDLFALRILVNEIKDCYGALGVIHALWHPLPGQFDDYIANPKENMYRSLHTVVLCVDAVPIEVQIRTYEMHQFAEYGVAAHWRYKEGGVSDSLFDEKMAWLRQLLEWQRDVTEPEEFLESVKTDIFKDQVYVYTPKGAVKELPTGATPIDFAYRIHTDLGHRCMGAKINGKLVPLDYQLKNGETVEILTTKQARGPSRDWLNANLGYVKTANALDKIRQWFRRQERGANIQLGREILHKDLRRLNLAVDEAKLSELLKYDTVDDLLAALGSGSINISQITAKLSSQQPNPPPDYQLTTPTTGPASGIEVLGVGDLLTRMAQCCSPIRGDAIIGFVTRSRGVTVHRLDCPNILAEDDKERLVRVDWGKLHQLFPVRLRIEAWDRVGLFKDITTLVSEQRINIAAVVSTERDDGTCSISLTVHTTDVGQLSRLFSKLEGVKGVISIARTDPKDLGLPQSLQ
ncbi:MAG: bifunctional (p)ppGpp synthetase/guanosine-3',5'-bis(diphosphate) 3'-pyrophosphohydrolase [Chloroflexi bacterium]|nr:bifunctional (p)ppGpp synthetase/guanosine-3',5'-bis(diphosphate) 3'-pyrophosphohydrolase [Chloroflexota bacterium]